MSSSAHNTHPLQCRSIALPVKQFFRYQKSRDTNDAPTLSVRPAQFENVSVLFRNTRRQWHHVQRTAHCSRQIARTRKSPAAPGGASEAFSRFCKTRVCGAYLHLPESEEISLTWKKRRPCGVPSSLLALASRLSSR